MDHATFSRMIHRMAVFPDALTALLGGVSDNDARWKPEHGGWSIVEIVNHLIDEESEDFRTRVRLTLKDPGMAWPPIDPEGVAVERRYNERVLVESLDRFASARVESIQWLRSLDQPDWSKTHTHPNWGAFRAGDIFVSWCAHDALHLRQVAKRFYEMSQRDGEWFETAYAGDW